jgi:hypothetical protein
MTRALKQEVRTRARGQCEYCRLPEAHYRQRFHLEHVVARQHRGPTTSANLALSCPHCNFHKGTNLSGVDPETGAIVTLFNPREHAWGDHFRWEAAGVIVGITVTGRATVETLLMNDGLPLAIRTELLTNRFVFDA